MPTDVLQQLGIGGIFAVLLVREVLSFFREKGNGNGSIFTRSERTEWSTVVDQVRDLHIWHAKTDASGTPIWYIGPNLERSLKVLRDSIHAQELAIRDLRTLLNGRGAQQRKTNGTPSPE